MNCQKCGSPVEAGVEFCSHCGAEQKNVVSVASNQTQIRIPDRYKPISAWGYVGYQLLFSIPVIGFIMMLVFACGGASNINLKNFSRSYLCMLLLVVAIGLIALVVSLAVGAIGTAGIMAAVESSM